VLEGGGLYFVVTPAFGGLAEFVFDVSAFTGIFWEEVPGTSGSVDLHVWVSIVWGVIRMLCKIGFVIAVGYSNKSTSGDIGIVTSCSGYVTAGWKNMLGWNDRITKYQNIKNLENLS